MQPIEDSDHTDARILQGYTCRYICSRKAQSARGAITYIPSSSCKLELVRAGEPLGLALWAGYITSDLTSMTTSSDIINLVINHGTLL